MSNSQRQITKLDPNMIERRSFEEEYDAKRVYIVNPPYFDPIIKQTTDVFNQQPSIERIVVPTIVQETKIERIEIPTIIKEIEIREVQVPIIIKEIQEVVKEIPVIQTKIEVIEKPVIIEKIEYKNISFFLKACLAVQVLGNLILLLKVLK